jgi:signal transduction histidine kinase
VVGLADSGRLLRALHGQDSRSVATMEDLLADVRQVQGLDFLQFLTVHRSTELAEGWPVIRAALAGVPRSETEVFSPAQLRLIEPRLAERAVTSILPTANAAPDQRSVEDRGLVIHAAAPVRDAKGEIIGVLAGGVLLNGNLGFIDRLNEIVYPDGALPLGSRGTATLFLGDVRVATNVRLFEGGRAIGTRVSAAVHAAVLDEGRTWLDRAFVVQDWYVSAYEPLLNSHAERHATMHAIDNGEVGARVGSIDSRDELGVVAAHFDQLLDRLQSQAASLKRWGESLDAKVAERTAELESAVTELRSTQSQLVMNEKLAAIGQLTAGVAHEINNPVAVIQGNLDVLRDLLGPAAEPVAPEIRLIYEQVHRIRLIVTKLLQFARPQDYVGYLEPVVPQQLIQDSLLLVGHLLKKGNVAIEQHIDSSRQVTCNRNELQQVLINLMVNAIQAMPEGGTMTLAAEDWDEADMPVGLKLVVADSGLGITPEDQARLFKPFFTAKKPDGTGLGLWVSQSLVERYGGRISIDSEPGKGTRFVVWLRFEPLV